MITLVPKPKPKGRDLPPPLPYEKRPSGKNIHDPPSGQRLLARPENIELLQARLHSMPLTTAESEAVKPGAMRSIKGQSLLAFRPMSLECPLLVAQRFHVVHLQVRNNIGLSLRFTSSAGSPVAVWTIYDAPRLLPGEEFELHVMNANGSPHHYAASIVGATFEGAS